MISLLLGLSLNAIALVLLIVLHGHRIEAHRDSKGSVTAIVGPTSVSTASKAVPRPPPVSTANAFVEFLPFSTMDLFDPGDSAQGCAVLDDVAASILADPAAVEAVVHAPPQSRSVADAIIIWNGDWSADTAEPQGPLEPVRANVAATLQAAKPECLSAIISGPRLIPIPNGEETLFLVFGSGDWSWQSLAGPSPADPFDLGHWLGFN